MICGSSASTAPSAVGRWRSALQVLAPASSLKRSRSFASVSASRNSAVSWVVKALVEATPISTPACVRNCSRVSRIIALEATLQIASVRFWPSDCACLSAASVSAVSPDCETTTTSVFGSGTLAR